MDDSAPKALSHGIDRLARSSARRTTPGPTRDRTRDNAMTLNTGRLL
ncbi:hypothetical protein [Micromonospora rubida]